jgi:hypothetical protein
VCLCVERRLPCPFITQGRTLQYDLVFYWEGAWLAASGWHGPLDVVRRVVVVVPLVWRHVLFIRHTGPCSESATDVFVIVCVGPADQSHGAVVRNMVCPVVMGPTSSFNVL